MYASVFSENQFSQSTRIVPGEGRQFRILHCLRAPLGGLFRHVCDLAEAQVAAGHEVGIICDAGSGGPTADKRLKELSSSLSLGVMRVEMSRNIGLSDISAFKAVKAHVVKTGADVIHGHGAKGGAYGRLVSRFIRSNGGSVLSFYTPHGGSLHYSPSSIKGRIYLTLERLMASMTSGIIFESAYSARAYSEKVGEVETEHLVVPNGLQDEDFIAHAPEDGAADIVFVGELRELKGVDLLLRAIAEISKTRPVSAHFYGDGPDGAAFEALARELGIEAQVDFPGRLPARQAFNTGRLLVVPSRAESFPYIVLEAGAAGIPMIASRVGGIPEIVGTNDFDLVRADDLAALTSAVNGFLSEPGSFLERAAHLRRDIKSRFRVSIMAQDITGFYQKQSKMGPACHFETPRSVCR